MTQTKTSVSHRVLLVDADDAVREMLKLTLEAKGFDVTPAATVTEALKLIVAEIFDVLRPAHAEPERWFCGNYSDAPLTAERAYAASAATA